MLAIAGCGSSTSTEVSTSATSAPPAGQTTTVPPVVPTSSVELTAAPAERALDPGCEETPPAILDAINGSLAPNGFELAETAAVSDGDRLYIAGEVHRLSDGAVDSRDDLFVEASGAITPVTATVRRESTLPDLRDLLGVDFQDDAAQQALDCARTYKLPGS